MQGRDEPVDAVRGVAVFTMVAANAAAVSLAEPHPFLFRLYGSFAAPVFIALAGMMAARAARAGGPFRDAALRGLAVLAVGALVDAFVWGIVPGTTVDVLYLIGLAIPLAWLAARAPAWVPWAAAAAVLLATPFLQSALGYTPYPTEYGLDGTPTYDGPGQTTVLAHWLVDGWFPVFPWLGFAFVGAGLARVRADRASSPFLRAEGAVASAGLAVAGAALWAWQPGRMLVRAGYSELFYEPTLGYVLTSLGVLGLLLVVADRVPGQGWRPLALLGSAALLMYVAHLLVIRFVLDLVFVGAPLLPFLAVYVAVVAALVGLASGVERWKARRGRSMPFVVRLLVGG